MYSATLHSHPGTSQEGHVPIPVQNLKISFRSPSWEFLGEIPGWNCCRCPGPGVPTHGIYACWSESKSLPAWSPLLSPLTMVARERTRM
eukprot:2821226-Rhodomonas_salina.1